MFWTIHILLHPLTSNDSNWKKSRLMVVCRIIRMTIMGSTLIALSATSISFWTYHVIMDLAMHPSFLSMLMKMVMILPFMPLFTVVTRKHMTGRRSVHSLVGNLKTLLPIRSSTPHVMVALLLIKTPSRNILRLLHARLPRRCTVPNLNHPWLSILQRTI